MSTFRRPLVTTRTRGLLGFPEELQVRILEELSGGDLLACQKVCQLWKAVITDTTALQHIVGLTLTGMIDGPSLAERASTVVRAKAIKAYQSAWDANQVPHLNLKPLSKCSFVGRAAGSADVFVYKDNEKPVLTLHRPASFFNGVTEKVWTVNYGDYFDEESDDDDDDGYNIDEVRAYEPNSVAVDAAQDLIVLTKMATNEFPECFFLSLSQHGAPHPLAHSVRLCTGSNTCWLQEFPEEIAIVGDLIEWTVFGVDTSLSVYNWKTGEEWRHGACDEDRYGQFVQDYNNRCHILDSTHVARIVDTDMIVHAIQLDGSRDRNHSAGHDPNAVELCKLQLPPLADGFKLVSVKCRVQRPPTYTDCAPHFQGDPSLTVLVVEYVVSGPDRERPTIVAIIPLSTILEAVRRIEDSLPGRGKDKGKGKETKAVPWDQFVDHGARIIVLPGVGEMYSEAQISTIGSKVAISFRSKTTKQSSKELLLFDMHSHAQAASVPEDPRIESGRVLISDCFTKNDTSMFRDPVRSTLPYRVARMQVACGARQKVHVVTDGLLLV